MLSHPHSTASRHCGVGRTRCFAWSLEIGFGMRRKRRARSLPSDSAGVATCGAAAAGAAWRRAAGAGGAGGTAAAGRGGGGAARAPAGAGGSAARVVCSSATALARARDCSFTICSSATIRSRPSARSTSPQVESEGEKSSVTSRAPTVTKSSLPSRGSMTAGADRPCGGGGGGQEARAGEGGGAGGHVPV